MGQHRLTQDGVKRLKTELESLRRERSEIIEVVRTAREQGDLKENFEYQSAKTTQEQIETRIAEIEDVLKNSTTVDDEKSAGDLRQMVGLGSLVTLEVEGSRDQLTFRLVDTIEADPFANKISSESAIGKVLIDKIVGDKVALSIKNTQKICQIIQIK